MNYAQKRSLRYVRNPEFKNTPLVLMARDMQIMKALSDYRFLNTDQIEKLFFSSTSRTRKRLFQLWQHELLERIPQYISETGSSPMVYALSRQGGKIVAEHKGCNLHEISYIARQRRLYHTVHTLRRNDVRICLELVSRREQGLKLIFWNQNPREIGTQVYMQNNKVALVPDGYFILQDDIGNTWHFLLEIDRTVAFKAYARKLKGYYRWYLEKGHISQFGAKNIRLLTVTYRSRIQRLYNLAMRVRSDKKGSGIFYFTTFSNISLDRPDSLLFNSIWQIAHEGKDDLHPLL